MRTPRIPKTREAVKYAAMMAAAEQYVREVAPACEDPASVASLLRPLAQKLAQEVFWVILLSAKHNVLAVEEVTRGLADRAQVHAREVFRTAIRYNACKVLLAHNHPSGDPTPSAQDIACTRSLVEAGKIVGIEVVDHVVIGVKTPARLRDWLSFREEGLM